MPALVAALALVALGFTSPPCSGQSPTTPTDLRYPERPTSVVTRDERGNEVVGLWHVDAGPSRVVLLPNGELVERPRAEAPETERAFEPLTVEALAAQLTEQVALQGFRTRSTRRHVYVSDASEEFVAGASRIMESMFHGVVLHAQAQKIAVTPPLVPLPVIVFRQRASFQAYRRMPAGIVAYYDVLTNRVVICEETGFDGVRPDLALQQSLSTIAHEGAHQILHNIGVQQRLSRWPMWLAEGLAEYYAPTSVDRRWTWKGAGEVNDLRMFELELFIKGGGAGEGRLVADTVVAGRLSSTGYAAAWALTHYLARRDRDAFNAYVREVSRLRPLQSMGEEVGGVVPDNRRLFEEHFGADPEAIEERVVQHLNRLPYQDPFAAWPHFLGMATTGEGRKLRRQAEVFHREEDALAWARRTLERSKGPGQAAVRPFANRAEAERGARQFVAGG